MRTIPTKAGNGTPKKQTLFWIAMYDQSTVIFKKVDFIYIQIWILPPGVCAIKHYRLVMYGFHSKWVCLTKSVKEPGNSKKNLYLVTQIFRTFQIHNVLKYRSMMSLIRYFDAQTIVSFFFSGWVALTI